MAAHMEEETTIGISRVRHGEVIAVDFHLICGQANHLIPIVCPGRLTLPDNRLDRGRLLAPELHPQPVTFTLGQGQTALINARIPEIGQWLRIVKAEFVVGVIGDA